MEIMKFSRRESSPDHGMLNYCFGHKPLSTFFTSSIHFFVLFYWFRICRSFVLVLMYVFCLFQIEKICYNAPIFIKSVGNNNISTNSNGYIIMDIDNIPQKQKILATIRHCHCSNYRPVDIKELIDPSLHNINHIRNPKIQHRILPRFNMAIQLTSHLSSKHLNNIISHRIVRYQLT